MHPTSSPLPIKMIIRPDLEIITKPIWSLKLQIMWFSDASALRPHHNRDPVLLLLLSLIYMANATVTTYPHQLIEQT